MKQKIFYVAFLLVCVSATYLFAQNAKLRADHQELQEHYNSCTKVINEIRDARINFSRGNSGTWGKYKSQVMGDLDRVETTLFQYRTELEKQDEHIMRQDLRAKERR